MAASTIRNPLGSAQEHIPTREKHNLRIDITCEDCDEFICSQCAKTDHKNHDWETLSTAGSLRRRDLKKTIDRVKEKDVKEMDEMIQMATKQMEDNQKCCDSEISKLQKHFDTIISKLEDMKTKLKTKLKGNLERKNAEVSDIKSDFEKKKKQVMDLLEFLEEKYVTMSDHNLIDNLKDLKKLESDRQIDIQRGFFSVSYIEGDVTEMSVETIIGQTLDLDDITVIERGSFQYGLESMDVLEAIEKNESDSPVLFAGKSGHIELHQNYSKSWNITLNANDMCLTNKGQVFFTDFENKKIDCFGESASFITAPLIPGGICQSTEGGLLVTLTDNESEPYKPDSNSRRLVRHVTLTGDVIREYEYQEDGQTRLFTIPYRVRQNGNSDICVVNRTSEATSEMAILSSSGNLKTVYYGNNQGRKCLFSDVVFDLHCNIILSDVENSQIHLLRPDGKYVKYLLTRNEITRPSSISLCNATLWVGHDLGLVTYFDSQNMNQRTNKKFLEKLSLSQLEEFAS